jgi:hypothetical protein
MKAIFKEREFKVTHEIVFHEDNGIDFEFSKKELESENAQDVVYQMSVLAATPFIRYCRNAAVDTQHAEQLKEFYLSELTELLDQATKNVASADAALRIGADGEEPCFMEDIYKDWLALSGEQSDAFLSEFRKYTFLKLRPSIGDRFTVEMVFLNRAGHQVVRPLKWLCHLHDASEEEIRMHISYCFLIALAILDKLGNGNPLLEEDMPDFENEIFNMIKAAAEND